MQIPLPEEPDTDDEAKIKKWKWKVRSVKKENRERYSQRCDVELKLAVSSVELYVQSITNPYSLMVTHPFICMGAGSTENEG